MDIGQALRRFRSDDKVRREAWEEGRFLDPAADEDTVLNLTYEDLLASDWEVYDGQAQ